VVVVVFVLAVIIFEVVSVSGGVSSDVGSSVVVLVVRR
jgi:hypothetical protein